jgi:glycosyltransferase involved in cell wall biosynthesis
VTSAAVCVLAYLRPEGLGRVLDGISRQQVGADVHIRVVVVDNDPAASGRPVVEGRRAAIPWPVDYVVEPRPGISAARNAAIAAGSEGSDFVAFLDDDEVPGEGWLAEMLRVQQATGADLTVGPVLPHFEHRPPEWIARSAVFRPPRYPTGHRLHYGATGNLLISVAGFPAGIPSFPHDYGLIGGEDTHFFMRAHLAGHSIVWADQAEVLEFVPPPRTRLRWILGRQHRRGNTLSLCLRDLEDSLPRRLKRTAAAAVNIGQGVAMVVGSPVAGRVRAVQGLEKVWFGAGLLTGLGGLRYRQRDGPASTAGRQRWATKFQRRPCSKVDSKRARE